MNPRTALPLLAVSAVLLAGCSGSSDKPKTLPSLTPTPVATSSPAAVPAAAKAKTPQGADAFVRFFFDQMNIAFNKSDAGVIRALQNGECLTCENYEKALDANRAKHVFIRGASFVVTSTAAAPLAAVGARVEVFGTIPAREKVTATGGAVESFPARGPFHFVVTVQSLSESWRVTDIAPGSR